MTTLTRAHSAHEHTTTFVRSWPSVAAWGAALVQAALGAGAIVSPEASTTARGIGVILVSSGLVLLTWGAFSLSRGRIVQPRIICALSLFGVLAMVALLVAAPARTSILAATVGGALLLLVGAWAAAVLRRSDRADGPPRPVGITGLLLAAAVTTLVVTPALGAVQNAVTADQDGVAPLVDHGH